MTQWVENPVGGRERGPRGLARAWTEVLVRPRRFFRNGVAPGDQAPGLVFGVLVVLVATATRLALVPAARPDVAGGPLVSSFLVLAVAGLLVAPLVLHLVAALQTLFLLAVVPADQRGGVSETVQVLAYAAAPCVLAGLPIPALQVACGAYGAALLAIGIAERNGIPLWQSVLLTLLPSALVFGYGFQAFAAASVLLSG